MILVKRLSIIWNPTGKSNWDIIEILSCIGYLYDFTLSLNGNAYITLLVAWMSHDLIFLIFLILENLTIKILEVALFEGTFYKTLVWEWRYSLYSLMQNFLMIEPYSFVIKCPWLDQPGFILEIEGGIQQRYKSALIPVKICKEHL